jgi:hypothetical protein
MMANQQQAARLGAELADARRRLALASSDETFFKSQSATARELSVGSDDANPERCSSSSRSRTTTRLHRSFEVSQTKLE